MPEEDDLRARLQELLEQSRESGERFFADVGKVVDNLRNQVGHQLGQLGLVTKEDLERLERKLDDLAASSAAASEPAAGKEPTKGTAGKQKSGSGKGSGKKSSGKKSADAA